MRATLKTLAVLLGIWATLALVGVIAHFTMEGGLLRNPVASADSSDTGADADADEGEADADADSEEGDEGEEGRSEAVADAGPAAASATTEEEEGAEGQEGGEGEAGEAGEGDQASQATASAEVIGQRLRVCEEGSVEPSLVVAQIVGDERPEILIGCANGWHLLGTRRGGAPMRIAVFSAPEAPAGTHQVTGQARVGDLTGGSGGDLLLPVALFAGGGASRGGGLFMVPRGEFGGFGAPTRLASIAATAVAIGPLDANDGNDLLALNQTNAMAGLPSEAWLFRGGPAPERQMVLATSPGGVALALVDLDIDEHLDAVAVADRSGKVDVRFSDGQGSFPRSQSFELSEVDEAAVGDLDGDGHPDLLLHAEGVVLLRAAAGAETLAPRRLGEAPSTLRGLELMDIDGDSRLDVVGWDHPRLLALAQVGELSFEARVLSTLGSGPFGPRRHRLADLDGDGDLDLVVLGSAQSAEASEAAPDDPPPLELWIVPDILEHAQIRAPGEARPMEDAPLVLRVPLR